MKNLLGALVFLFAITTGLENPKPGTRTFRFTNWLFDGDPAPFSEN